MYCRNCSSPIDSNATSCPRCGQPSETVPVGQPGQPAPGQPAAPGQPFSPAPGQPFSPAPGQPGLPGQAPYGQPQPMVMQGAAAGAKQRMVYILLALFLGGLGIHNFCAGYTGKGVAQLLITLLLSWWLVFPILGIWIWVIIEICTVTQDAQGVPFQS